MSLNPRIDSSTPVLIQGMTGRTGQMHARLMRAAGTNIVAGVSPNKGGDVDGVPVFATCAEAVNATGAQACVAFVSAFNLLDAATEAIDAGIRLLVTPTEGVPVHDALRIKERVTAANVLWIGPSTPGMAVAGAAKLGFLPDASLKPGALGVMSKSGTLSYEVGYRLANAGIGTSVWVGVGGDMVKGVRYADLVPFYASDAATKGLLIIGEIGGEEEEELAEALIHHKFAKPVFAIIAGRTAPSGVAMGHAGAIVHGSQGTFASKRAALERAGASVFERLDDMVTSIGTRITRP